ncbi:MAG: DUF2313 domain-containing protein [Proteobacteria bacterium]|nr:DUF2313 domain-containing protein [Pseudomonadota bacterium]
MSRWFVNDAWTTFYAADHGPVRLVDCRLVDDVLDLDTRDALSDPSVAALLPAGLALWPRGAAWGSPDGVAVPEGSVIARFTSALLSGFADLYRAAWRLTLESRSATVVESLAEWEEEFGLPDPCATEAQSEEQRRANLRARVAQLATITPGDVVRLSARLGFVVALEEPSAFCAGVSECGGIDEPSDTALEQQFVLHIFDAPFAQFEVGIHEAGVDRLLDFDHGILACAIHRISPAWTYPVFSIAPLPAATMLVTEDGKFIVTETGARLIAPTFA